MDWTLFQWGASALLSIAALRLLISKERTLLTQKSGQIALWLAVPIVAQNFQPAWAAILKYAFLLAFPIEIYQFAQIYRKKISPNISIAKSLIVTTGTLGMAYVSLTKTVLFTIYPVVALGLQLLGMINAVGWSSYAVWILMEHYQKTVHSFEKAQLKYLSFLGLGSLSLLSFNFMPWLGLAGVAVDSLGYLILGAAFLSSAFTVYFKPFRTLVQGRFIRTFLWGSFLGVFAGISLGLLSLVANTAYQVLGMTGLVLGASLLLPELKQQIDQVSQNLTQQANFHAVQARQKLLSLLSSFASDQDLVKQMDSFLNTELNINQYALVLWQSDRKLLLNHNQFDDFFLEDVEKVANLFNAHQLLFKNSSASRTTAANPLDSVKNIHGQQAFEPFVRSGVCFLMPLFSEDKVLGYLLIGSKKNQSYYTYQEFEFFDQLARSLSLIKFKLEVFKHQYQSSKDLQSLHVASQVLGSTSNWNDLLDNIVLSFLQMVKVDRGILFLYDEKTKRLNGAAGHGAKRSDIEKIHLSTQDTILGHIFNEGQAVYVPKVTHQTEHVRKLDVESYIAVPIKLRDKVIGLFALDNRISKKSLEHVDLRLLETLANHTAVAIENIRLFQEAQMRDMELSSVVKERETLEHQVRRQDKLSVLGTMAAGVAHEIKNPLSSLKLFSEMMQENAEDPKFWHQYGGMIQSEIARLEKIVENFLGFARNKKLKLELMPASQIVNKVHELVKAEAHRQNIVIKMSYAEPEPTLYADASQMVQVLLNLVLNAIQAIDPGQEQSFIKIKIDSHELNRTQIEIEDNGCGIPEEDLEKLFTPFYSTKEKGTGLGLSIIYKIVEEHGGSIKVSSQVGQGTQFILDLPAQVSHQLSENIIPLQSFSKISLKAAGDAQ